MPGNSYAYAYANNHLCYIRWHTGAKIRECLGFSVHRVSVTKLSPFQQAEEALPSWVGFAGLPKPKDGSTTDVWPIQKFEWLDRTPPREGAFKYRVIPMIGVPGELHADESRALETNEVALVSDFGNISATFLLGIASASISRGRRPGAGAKSRTAPGGDNPEPGVEIVGPLGPRAEALAAIRSFLSQMDGGGRVCGAFHNLTDRELTMALAALDDRVELVLTESGARRSRHGGAAGGASEVGNHARTLRIGRILITRRHLARGASHNHFLVYVDAEGRPQSVLTGSLKWSAMCLRSQTNHLLQVRASDVAGQYLAYWRGLQREASVKPVAGREAYDVPPVSGTGENAESPPPAAVGGAIRAWLSPCGPPQNTPYHCVHGCPDLMEVHRHIDEARESILFIAHRPGSPSIAQHIRDVHRSRVRAGRPLYISGTSTDPLADGQFVEVFKRGISHMVQGPARARATGAGVIDDAFSRLQEQLHRAGETVIHETIVVIDHGSEERCVVIAGSHNLNCKSSCLNEENLVIITGRSRLARACAAHASSVTEHFLWRWHLQQDMKLPFLKRGRVWSSLGMTDGWQDKYFEASNEASHDSGLLCIEDINKQDSGIVITQ